MDVRELQIGDWVIQRLADGTSFGVVKQMQPHMFTQGNFEPIELTPEILEKNGFKIGYGEHRENEGLIDDVNKHYYIKVGRWNHKKNEVGHCECWSVCLDQHSPIYVHELQHALRSCKLYELADSIVI